MQSSNSFLPMVNTPSSRHSSPSSPPSNLSSTRAQRRGSRATNACEACKKRKTKCSGPPGPCGACQKVESFCHFNARLDTRRKLAYKPAAVQERQQHILHGLLQMLKFGEDDEILNLINLIRGEALPQDIAACLRKNIRSLQDRGILQSLAVDETDIMSLGLQGLFSHRAGRPGPKQSPKKLASSMKDSLRSQELRLQPEELNGKDHSTPSSSCSRGVKSERHEFLLSPVDGTNLQNPLTSPNSMSMPSEDMNQSLSLSSCTTEDSFPHHQDAIYSDAQPRCVDLYQSHHFNDPVNPRQWSARNDATGSIAPQLTFKEHAGGNGHAMYPHFGSALPGDNTSRAFSANPQAAMNVNAYASRQLNDLRRVEYELSSRHGNPHIEWNFPNWTYAANTIQDGY